MPSLQQCQNNRWDPPIMIPATEMLDSHNKIQYLDLDLPTTNPTHTLLEEDQPEHNNIR
jgi:hypothetical protein